jgi:peptidoglycan/xylan/chitin deacetylase (PgdA/CDA1 family)
MRKGEALARVGPLGVGAAALTARIGVRRPALAGVLAGGAGAAVWASLRPNSPVLGPVVVGGARDVARAALTFDDGPRPSTPAVLDALDREGVRATFFVLGRQARAHPVLVRRIAEAGHQLASHGYDHGILVFRSAGHVADQLRRTEKAVADACGADLLTRLFRAPHGYRGPLTWIGARRAGYRMAGWSAGVWDTAKPGPRLIADRVARALAPGAVILLHDADGWGPGRAYPQTADALPAVCRAARDRGLRLVRMDELTGGAA